MNVHEGLNISIPASGFSLHRSGQATGDTGSALRRSPGCSGRSQSRSVPGLRSLRTGHLLLGASVPGPGCSPPPTQSSASSLQAASLSLVSLSHPAASGITTTETAEPPVATAAAAVRWVNESDFQQSLEAAVLASKAEDQIQF